MTSKTIIVLCFLASTKGSIIEAGYSPIPAVSHSSFQSSPILTKTVIGPIKKTIITPTAFATATPVHYETVISTEESKFKTLDGAEHSKFSKSVDTAYSTDQLNSHITNGDLVNHDIPVTYITHADPVYHHHGYNINNQGVHIGSPQIKTVYSAPVSKTFVTPSIFYDPYLSSDNTKSFTPTAYSSSFSKIGIPIYDSSIRQSGHNYYAPLTISQPSQYNTYKSYVTTADKLKNDVPTYFAQTTKNQVPFLKYGPPAVEKSLNRISHGPVVLTKSATTYSEAPVVSHLSFSGLGTNYGW